MKLQVLFLTLVNPIPSLASIHFKFRLKLNQDPASYTFYYIIEVEPAKILLLPREKKTTATSSNVMCRIGELKIEFYLVM